VSVTVSARGESWPIKRLSELSDAIQYGYTAKAKTEADGIRYLRITDIQDDQVDWSTVPSCDISETDASKYLLSSGDLVFARTGATVGKSFLVRGKLPRSVFASYLIRVRLRRGIEPRYVAYFFRSPAYWTQIAESAAGIGQPNVNGKKLAEIRVPVARPDQQLAIVAEIEKQFSRLDEAVGNLQRVKANLERYKSSVLQAAVEGRLGASGAATTRLDELTCADGRELCQRLLSQRRAEWAGKTAYREPTQARTEHLPGLPKGWGVTSLEAATSANRVICYGILMPKEDVPDGVLYVKVRDMRNDVIDVDRLQRTSKDIAAKYARASLREGDLLLSIRGTYGRVAEVPAALEGGNITQDTARLAVSPLLSSRFLAVYLRSETAQRYFKDVARGVAVKGVNIGDLRPMPVPVPPIAEQERIADEVDRHLSVIREIAVEVGANLRRAQSLRQAILAKQYSGD
jgi:type I restriction enzyme, S subunit